MEKEKAAVAITADELKSILSTVIAEARKPPEPTEEEKAVMASEKAMRKQTAEQSLAAMENKRREQAACIHMRRDGSSTAVYVHNGNFFICQQCQAVIHPGVRPEGSDDTMGIYDTQLFNRLFQLQPGDVF